MIIEKYGEDIFQSGADVLVNTVNTQGIMSKGLALKFKIRYPEMFKDYKLACQTSQVFIGHGHVWKNDSSNDTTKFILNLPTKRNWQCSSKMEYIDLGLIWMRMWLVKNEVNSVAIPCLGCGLGSLDEKLVRGRIKDHLKDEDLLTIYLY